jgi:hypothetical protein
MPLVLNGTTGVQDNSGAFVIGTAVATTSGFSVDFVSIPSWVKRITVNFNNVSTNGASNICMQLGTSAGLAGSGYLGSGGYLLGSNVNSSVTATGVFLVSANVDVTTSVFNGVSTVTLLDPTTNTWAFQSNGARSDGAANIFGAGSVTLSGVLTRLQINTQNGTDTFDSGKINILYE